MFSLILLFISLIYLRKVKKTYCRKCKTLYEATKTIASSCSCFHASFPMWIYIIPIQIKITNNSNSISQKLFFSRIYCLIMSAMTLQGRKPVEELGFTLVLVFSFSLIKDIQSDVYFYLPLFLEKICVFFPQKWLN